MKHIHFGFSGGLLKDWIFSCLMQKTKVIGTVWISGGLQKVEEGKDSLLQHHMACSVIQRDHCSWGWLGNDAQFMASYLEGRQKSGVYIWYSDIQTHVQGTSIYPTWFWELTEFFLNIHRTLVPGLSTDTKICRCLKPFYKRTNISI
jgi:hypothetical protein